MSAGAATDKPWPDVHGLILDLDGTVYRGDEPIPGAFEALHAFDDAAMPVVFVTNNATKSRDEFAAKLTRLGYPTRAEQIISSAYATAETLAERYRPGTRVYVVGEQSLTDVLRGKGFLVTEQAAEVVVTGLDRSFTYDTLRTAIRLILAGAEFVATNPDRLIPAGSQLDPGAGTLVAAIAAATREPLVIGKPEPTLLKLAIDALGTPPDNTIMVGDQLHTDIRAGQRAGLYSVLTTTGVPPTCNGSVVPDKVIDDLREIPVRRQRS